MKKKTKRKSCTKKEILEYLKVVSEMYADQSEGYISQVLDVCIDDIENNYLQVVLDEASEISNWQDMPPTYPPKRY